MPGTVGTNAHPRTVRPTLAARTAPVVLAPVEAPAITAPAERSAPVPPVVALGEREREHELLERARAAGIANFGLHRQSAALMTCVVPTAARSDHIHFIDGAAGGYALAARAMKAT